MIAKPFLKWVGGKTKLVPELVAMFPKKFNNYYEPFVGGGALFYEVVQKYKVGFSSINDINKKLITAYIQIKQDPKGLIKFLEEIDKEYKKLSLKEQRGYFNLTRIKYNEGNIDDTMTAAYLIFLNKTCFNGMYRENSKGEYNIPFGDQKNPNICDEENILAVSRCLKDTKITNLSFEDSVKKCNKGDLIYFDPPYYPVNATSNFTGYSKNSFGETEQRKLRDVFISLAKKDCFVMMSNSHTPFIEELYKDFYINYRYAARSINSKGDKRGKIKEVVVTSYPTSGTGNPILCEGR
ncbi:TPA: DNA methyltransferase [Candidatus Shapirobacteria bacterium]|nr:DNA methyltransferase [Candidatus Shapirobacteria bacterium]